MCFPSQWQTHISVNTRTDFKSFSPSDWCGGQLQNARKDRPMKTPILIIAAMSAALLGSAFGEEPSPSPPIDACNYSSWNPEAYCFYGEKAKIVDKLSNLSTAKLSERRVYLQITQGESSGNVKLYERQKNGTFIVTEWTI